MSKNLGLLQNGSGKLGNVVLQRNNVQRVRKRQINNPRSKVQQISRMIAATSTRTYSALKGIVDHSFQGIAYGGKSMNYFLKHAMRVLRNNAALVGTEGEPLQGYSPKYASGPAFGPFLVSKGNLPSIGEAKTKTYEDGSTTYHDFAFYINDKETSIKPTDLAAVGVQAGDQITFVCIDMSKIKDGQAPIFKYARLVLTSSFDGTANAFTAAMIDAKSTPSAATVFSNGDDLCFVLGDEQPTAGYAAIILSRPDGNTWGRSTEYLAFAGDDTDWSDFADYLYNNALETWMEAGVTVGESDRYLNEGV